MSASSHAIETAANSRAMASSLGQRKFSDSNHQTCMNFVLASATRTSLHLCRPTSATKLELLFGGISAAANSPLLRSRSSLRESISFVAMTIQAGLWTEGNTGVLWSQRLWLNCREVCEEVLRTTFRGYSEVRTLDGNARLNRVSSFEIRGVEPGFSALSNPDDRERFIAGRTCQRVW
jgi:hypothetical protein